MRQQQIYLMLKFLEGRQKQIKPITVRNKPAIGFGISIEAPTCFLNQHTLISPTSYANPFVELQPQASRYMPTKLTNASLKWAHKTDISQIEEGKVIGSGDLQLKPNRFHESYYKEIRENSSRFRLTKGEFTDYISRNHLNNEGFGPLYGEERSAEKSLETKKSIIRKSVLMLQKSRDKLQQQQFLRKKSSRLLEKIIDQKRTLRHRRQDFYCGYKCQLSQRKTMHNQFNLPKVLTNRQNPKNQTKRLNFGLFKTIDNSILTQYIK